jgi:two-component sensor histidine kinase
MRADDHPRHGDRMQTLRSYDILDTPREAEFDDIAQLASSICDAPISLISFLDTDRNWFKANVGIDLQEAPRDTAFCAHGILADAFVEINDTLNDPRTADNPLALGDPNLRFYAGAQLVGHDGLPLGMLCVFDNKPRHLTEQQRNAMQLLARLVMKQLEVRRALRIQNTLRKEVDHRVKNSLQSVSSLIRLQGHASGSAEVRAALDTVHTRIETVAALHHALYRTDAGNSIPLDRYLARIAQLIGDGLPDTIHLDATFDPVTVDSSVAAATATILNEFATNSVKHAFGDARSGHLIFRGNRAADDSYHLILSDDGSGLSEPTGPNTGLGHLIIDAAIQQVEGRIIPGAGDGPGHRLHIVFAPALPTDD